MSRRIEPNPDEPFDGPDEPMNAAPRPVGPRRERYLVAPLALPGADPDAMLAGLRTDPRCVVHRVISDSPTVAVVEMDADRAALLATTPLVHVEPDLPLQYAAPAPTFADPGVIPLGDETTVSVLVLGGDDRPLEGAEVYLMSDTFPARGVTAEDGQVALSLPAGALHTLGGVYVKPRFDYWAVWLGHPELTLDAPNLVTCPAFAETFPGFPERQLDGWARKAMRFDALPPTFRGDGVKISIVDSGAAVEHPDLADRFAGGYATTDEAPGGTGDGWQIDTVGHGSHTSAIIGGSDNGSGIVGVVPEAELHSCKIFPDGRFSDLIEAIDYCVRNDIDVLNLSLGSPQPSQLLARKIEQARQAGVACIVAGGNSGGPVAFPASLPSVLAVAAIGKIGEFPPEAYHATQVWGGPTPEGYFSAAFTCHGPEIDVCAPGVAIVSAVPPTNYAAWDGTSFAVPYVSGLAALLLAHHPDFRGRFATRDTARVDRLFELIIGSCRPLALGDPGRSGAGLPDAVAALGLTAPVAMTPPSDPVLANLWLAMVQAGLVTTTLPVVPGATGGGPAGAAGVAAFGAPGFVMSSAHPQTAPARDANQPPSTTLTPLPGDAMAPLRAAMRAAGLLSRPEEPGTP